MSLIPFNVDKTKTYNRYVRARFTSEFTIACNINKNRLIQLIQFSFRNKGDLNVFGYNSKTDEYWAKKIVKNDIMLYFTLTIKPNSHLNSDIIINQIIGKNNEMQKFVFYLDETITLCKNSNFIKHCVSYS